MVPETYILSPTVGSYAFLLAAVLSHVIQQMGLVTCTWLLVRGADRPNQAHRPKMLQTALGMLGSDPGNNKGRVAWGHHGFSHGIGLPPAEKSTLDASLPCRHSPTESCLHLGFGFGF